MSLLTRFYYTIRNRIRGSDSTLIERLEIQNAEDIQAGRRLRVKSGSLQAAKSKYDLDMLQGDDTANKMMLQ